MAELPAWVVERDAAIALLEAAQANLDRVEPPELRDPLRYHFAAMLELCRAHRSLLGLPVNHAIQMAQAIVAAAT